MVKPYHDGRSSHRLVTVSTLWIRHSDEIGRARIGGGRRPPREESAIDLTAPDVDRLAGYRDPFLESAGAGRFLPGVELATRLTEIPGRA